MWKIVEITRNKCMIPIIRIRWNPIESFGIHRILESRNPGISCFPLGIVSHETWKNLIVWHRHIGEGSCPKPFRILIITKSHRASLLYIRWIFFRTTLGCLMLETIVSFVEKLPQKLTLIGSIFADTVIENICLFIKSKKNSIDDTPMDFRGKNKDF